jgi:hypothetical protein
VDAARRQLEAAGDVEEETLIQAAEQVLRLVQHLDEGVGPEPVALHRRVQRLEALVADVLS